MSILSTVLKLLGKPTSKHLSCSHGSERGSYTIFVLGVEVELKDTYMCAACTQDYLNKYSTVCHGCQEPIFPGQRVCVAPEGSQTPFVHFRVECGGIGAMYCGKWGEGKLVTLEKLYPYLTSTSPETA